MATGDETDYDSPNISIPKPRKVVAQTYGKGKRNQRAASLPAPPPPPAPSTETTKKSTTERSDVEDGDDESDLSNLSPSPKRSKPSHSELVPNPPRQSSEPPATQVAPLTSSKLKRTKSSLSDRKFGGARSASIKTRPERSVGKVTKPKSKKKVMRESENEGSNIESEADKRARKRLRRAQSNELGELRDKMDEGEKEVEGERMEVDAPVVNTQLNATAFEPNLPPQSQSQLQSQPQAAHSPTINPPAPVPRADSQNIPPAPPKVLGDKSNLTRASSLQAPIPRRTTLPTPLNSPRRHVSQNQNSVARRSSVAQSPRISVFQDPPISRTRSHQPRLQRPVQMEVQTEVQVQAPEEDFEIEGQVEEDINTSFSVHDLTSALPRADSLIVPGASSPFLSPRVNSQPSLESTRRERGEDEMSQSDTEIEGPQPDLERAGEFLPIVAGHSSMIVTEGSSELDLGTTREKKDSRQNEEDFFDYGDFGGGGGGGADAEQQEEDDTVVLSNISKVPTPAIPQSSLSPEVTRNVLPNFGQEISPSPQAPRTRPRIRSPSATSNSSPQQGDLSLTPSIEAALTTYEPFFSTLPPRHQAPLPDPPTKSGNPPKNEDDLAYLIRTTSTHENSDDNPMSSDEEAFKASEREIGIGMSTAQMEGWEERKKYKNAKRLRMKRQTLAEEDALVCAEDESDDELTLTGIKVDINV